MLSDFNRSLEIMDRCETDSIRLLCYDFPAHYNDVYKSYEYSRLCTILEGEKIVSVNKKDAFRYDANQYLILPPESKIHMTINRPTKAVVFELNPELIHKVNEKVSNEYSIDSKELVQSNFYIGGQDNDLKEILNKITSKFLKKGSKFLIDLYAQELAYHLIRNKGANQILTAANDNPVNRAIRYINSNCMNPISIRQISNALNMSEASFCQYFKKITNMTPNEYLIKTKLGKAKEMLKQESVTEVALELGYENISYFISLFKKEYEITPKQYKIMEQGQIQPPPSS